jgi:hypothetical protein
MGGWGRGIASYAKIGTSGEYVSVLTPKSTPKNQSHL